MAELPYVDHAVACQQMESVRPVKATYLAAPLRPTKPKSPNRPNKDMTNHFYSMKGNFAISKD